MNTDITQILQAIEQGDPQAADQLLPLVYNELRKLAAAKLAQEKPGQTLQATALVHEAYLRLLGGEKIDAHASGLGKEEFVPDSPGLGDVQRQFANRRHFYAAAAEAMRRILVEKARRKKRHKHGGGFHRKDFDPDLILAPEPRKDLIALDDALSKLARNHPLKAKLVELRYFAGLTGDEAACLLDISPSTADRHWTFARAWLRRELQKEEEEE